MKLPFRVGTGYDIHRLVPDRALILGGVTIPFAKGLWGHSDADALTHALMDGMLGALALGDIGHYFPPTDEQWKDANSIVLLQEVHRIIRLQGWEVHNMDASIVAERPKLKPYLAAMRTTLATALEIDPDQVSVKARTNEGLDAVGQEEAIAVHAVVMLFQPDRCP